MLAEVLQDHRGKLADHAAVHAQRAERAVQVTGVLDVTQRIFKTRELDPTLWQGDYENDPVFRVQIQNWVNQLWIEKDRRIAELRDERR